MASRKSASTSVSTKDQQDAVAWINVTVPVKGAKNGDVVEKEQLIQPTYGIALTEIPTKNKGKLTKAEQAVFDMLLAKAAGMEAGTEQIINLQVTLYKPAAKEEDGDTSVLDGFEL